MFMLKLTTETILGDPILPRRLDRSEVILEDRLPLVASFETKYGKLHNNL